MTAQWIRNARFVTKTSDTDFLSISDARMTFSVSQALTTRPKTLDIKVYNPSKDVLSKIKDDQQAVQLLVGYGGEEKLLFTGQTFQVIYGRENGTDTYLHVLATDGLLTLTAAVTNKSVPAGADTQAIADGLQKDAEKYEVKKGDSPKFPDASQFKNIRGYVMYGKTMKYIKALCDKTYCSTHIEDGSLHILPLSEKQENIREYIVVNQNTGMIGMPTVTTSGIQVKVLLNPDIKMGKYIKLNNNDIQQLLFSTATNDQAQVGKYGSNPDGLQQGEVASKQNAQRGAWNSDGLYKVMMASHTGDTRGNEWYTDILCWGVNSNPPAQAINSIPAQSEGGATSGGDNLYSTR